MANISIRCKCGNKVFIPEEKLKQSNWKPIFCEKCNALLKIPPKEIIEERRKARKKGE